MEKFRLYNLEILVKNDFFANFNFEDQTTFEPADIKKTTNLAIYLWDFLTVELYIIIANRCSKSI